MKSLQAQLLIATAELRDPNFERTVVLIVRHNAEEGALGVILNRPSQTKIREIWKQVSQSPCKSKARLNMGGPVAGPIMALHTQREWGEIEVLSGIHFTADPEKLASLVAAPVEPLRLFVGYAGWSPGQLENEMEQGSWRTAVATAEAIFSPTDRLWETLIRTSAAQSLADLLQIKHIPPDPLAN